MGSDAEPLDAASGVAALRRRDLAIAAGVFMPFASGPSVESALAEAGDSSNVRLQRLLISIGSNEDLEKELKFWTEALEMKILSDRVGSDGNRAVVVGYGPESRDKGGFFGIEFKVDPAVLKRPRPKLLNYDVMQPTVNALNFVQVTAKGKAIEIFQRVESSGGATLIGDAKYVDMESPRGVPVRAIPQAETPSVQLVCFNVEVPAFDAVVRFYKRLFGLKELKYPSAGAPVQKLSVLLESGAGGPQLLLSPVPDGRLKDRNLDEFEGVQVVSAGTADVEKKADVFVAEIKEEVAAKIKAAQEKWVKEQTAAGRQVTIADAPKVGRQKLPKPSVQKLDKTVRLDDGVGNILLLSGYDDFERTLA